MNHRHYLLKGTFLLTITGLITRIAGFFYKIFLSRISGAEEIGLFQMTAPVYAFCMALTFGGVQTAISRFTAEHFANRKKDRAIHTLFCGLLFSGSFSVLCAIVLFTQADFIAIRFLLEAKSTRTLQILSFSLPFCIIHGCINGYFIGQKNIAPSALSQLLEQGIRIGTVLLFSLLYAKTNRKTDASVMALGQLAGESFSALFCLCYLFFNNSVRLHGIPFLPILHDITSVALPLGLNRVFLCILQWMEAALLPQQLQRFGMNTSSALSAYGTLTGMALPVILFPTAVTGALGSLLLPVISEARSLKQTQKIKKMILFCVCTCGIMGIFCMLCCMLFGPLIGTVLFHSRLAGHFLRHLAFLCPFLYLNTTLVSILHGLGKSTSVFFINSGTFLIRLICTVFLVPDKGMSGYLFGLCVSQIFHTAAIILLRNRMRLLDAHFPGKKTDQP